jgi:hypothetical protein
MTYRMGEKIHKLSFNKWLISSRDKKWEELRRLSKQGERGGEEKGEEGRRGDFRVSIIWGNIKKNNLSFAVSINSNGHLWTKAALGPQDKNKEFYWQVENRIQVYGIQCLIIPFAKTVFWPLLGWHQRQRK